MGSSGVLTGSESGYNSFPFAYLDVGWERAFVVAGGLALLAAVVATLHGRRWGLFPLTLAVWSGLVGILLSGRTPGLPATWLINTNSAYIVFFVPLALMLALWCSQLARWLHRRPQSLQLVTYAAVGAVLTVLLLAGIQQQVTILNPVTRLARPADLEGLVWADENLPPDAVVAISSWQWLGGTWAGSDGGAWLLPLTARRTTTPPADYVYSLPLYEQVQQFNEAAEKVEDWSAPIAVDWLRAQDVSHIFVGARGGFFDPAALSRNPALELLYARNGVFVFALKSTPSTP